MFSMQQMREFLEASNQLPLLANNPPSTIWYSDKPPMLGGIPRRISIAEFMQIYTTNGGEAFEYTETVWCHPAVKQKANLIDQEMGYKPQHRPIFENYLRNPAQLTDKLIISFIDPKVGFGVFANEDIPVHSIIGVYSGVFTAHKNSPYGLSSDLLPGWSIEAQKKGGIARFFQHVPTSLTDYYELYCRLKKDEEMDEFFIPNFALSILSEPLLSFPVFVERYKKCYTLRGFVMGDPSITSENMGHQFYIIDGLPLFLFYSYRKINRYEQLGFNYGPAYWKEQLKTTPCLFNMQGESIGTGNTCQTCGRIALKLLTCAGCRQVYYCDSQCQKEDWKEHKQQCKK